MEHIDESTEMQVWQRVAQQPSQRSPELEPILRMSAESAAAYRDLARNATGKTREQLLSLMEGEKANIHCMMGILIAGGAFEPNISYPLPSREAPRRSLTRCVRRCRECYIAFASRVAEPEYGAAFQFMAQREQKQLETTLELLGKQK